MSELMMPMMGAAMVWMMFPLLMLPFLYIYLLQDFHGRREGKRDPNLGAQILLTCLLTVGLQLAIAGIAIIAVSIVGTDPGNDNLKTGAGFIVGGLLTGAFPGYIYFTRLAAEGPSRIGHKALGLNATVFGLVFSGVGTASAIAAFHDQEVKEPVAVAVIYLAASVVTLMRLVKNPLSGAEATIAPPRSGV